MRKQAFSLVELSIVLVILGLLTGGILAGQSLIRAAQLRSVATDLTRFQTSFGTFRDKYFYLPGDMPNATSFWGTAGGTGSDAACQTTISTDTKTCNGNGDGILGSSVIEYYRVWQHLANAGLIEGSYTGTAVSPPGSTGYNDVVGTNLPTSRITNVGYAARYYVSPYVFTPQASINWILLSKCCNGLYQYIEGSSLIKADEQWNLDTKLDDGNPAYGRVQAAAGYWSGCTTTSVAATAAYVLQNPNYCMLIYNLGY